jgi:hypothetical protein
MREGSLSMKRTPKRTGIFGRPTASATLSPTACSQSTATRMPMNQASRGVPEKRVRKILAGNLAILDSISIDLKAVKQKYPPAHNLN